jgi:hypothetical protein
MEVEKNHGKDQKKATANKLPWLHKLTSVLTKRSVNTVAKIRTISNIAQ